MWKRQAYIWYSVIISGKISKVLANKTVKNLLKTGQKSIKTYSVHSARISIWTMAMFPQESDQNFAKKSSRSNDMTINYFFPDRW